MDGTLTTAEVASNSAKPVAQSRTGWFAGKQGRKTKEAMLAYLFLLPAFVLVGLFGLFPLLFAAYQSTLRGINNIAGAYTGLDNYVAAIASFTYVLGFLGGVGLIIFAFYTIWKQQRAAKEQNDPYWEWALPGSLLGGGAVSVVGFILAILPLFLAIPAQLRGAQATRANYQAAIVEAFWQPGVQVWFWSAIALFIAGALIQRWVRSRPHAKAEPTNYSGVFTAAVIYIAGALVLLSLTWNQFIKDYGEAIASGQGLSAANQIIMMMAGFVLLLLSWFLWSSASGRTSTAGTVLRLMGAAVLLIGGWMLWAELPLAIAQGDKVWWQGVAATFWYSMGTIPPQLIISLLLAVLLFQNIRGKGFFRMVYFLPYIAPFVGTAAVFRIIFSARPTGAMNEILAFFGIAPLKWLNDPTGLFDMATGTLNLPVWMHGPSLALVVIMIYGVWSFFGFNTVIFLAGLGSIPMETYEAAQIDGAGRGAQFRHITLPLLSPTLYFLTLYSVIGTFKAFNHIYVLRTSAALGTTDTASVVIFNIFKRDLRFGYASALAILLLLIILALTVVNNRIAAKRVFYG